MVYVALLRGINVGGKNKVEMARLKSLFEALGFSAVRTYINSGNVIFIDGSGRAVSELAGLIEQAIAAEFGFAVKTLVRDIDNIAAISRELPDSWVNDASMKCDVMFLWDNFAKAGIIKELPLKPELEDVKYVGGAILWRVDRPNVTRSGMLKLAGTELYKHMTIRNCNTVRKLYQLMLAAKDVQLKS